MRGLKWAERVLAPYGKNPLGKSNLRMVWAPEVTIVIGGYWESDGLFSYRWRPRYPNKICWVLEKWISGREYGSPETWAASTCTADGYLACGPYPANGVYECCCMFDGIPVRFDTLSRVLYTILGNRCRTVDGAKAQHLQTAQAEENELDREFERCWDESHGVRRGLSFTSGGVLQYTNSDVEEYKARLAVARVKVRKSDFRAGFAQGELNV